MNQISSSEVPDLFRLYNNLYKLEMFTELLQNFPSTYTGRNKSNGCIIYTEYMKNFKLGMQILNN